VTAGDPALACEDLGFSFGSLRVLDGVSFEIEPGAVVALVGPNGSGKTTLLRIAAGVLSPDAGRVSYPTGGPRSVGYLPQSPAFAPGFSARRTVAFYDSLVKGGDAPDDLLARVGLTDVADRDVAALSGGMTRLLGLAQSLVGDPGALVLDEPTSGLDPAMTRRLFDLVDAATEAGAGVLVATHDLAAVDRVADEVLLLDGGRFLVRGTPDEIRAAADADSLDDAFVALVGREDRRVRSGAETDATPSAPVAGDGSTDGGGGSTDASTTDASTTDAGPEAGHDGSTDGSGGGGA